MEFDLSRFRDTFFQEADEHISEMESGLLSLEEEADAEKLNAIFRGAHSIKGASGTFGFEAIARFTHAMEGLLDRMRSGSVSASKPRIDLLLGSVDVLRRLVEAARSGSAAPENADATAQLLLVAHRSGEFCPEEPAIVRSVDQPNWNIRFSPSAEILRQGMDPILILRELGRLGKTGEVAVDVTRLPGLAALEPDTCYLSWSIQLQTEASRQDILDVFAFVEDGAEIEVSREARGVATAAVVAPAASVPAIESSRAGGPAVRMETGTLRVATGKVDKLIDLVGELVIAQSMAAQILEGFEACDLGKLQEAFAEVERYTRELQERLMGIRMLPIGNAFSRFPRLVRDLAASTGKQITLEIQGEDTELDKTVVERMADPLTHLIRNSIDHGIELPEQRLAEGKPATGVIRLSASHQGGSVVLEISDDGRGLDRERIRAKALARGLTTEGEEMPDERIYSMIFEPGFSTAETVTDISGRGVGMDVVKRSVEGLNGTIAISSEPGRGASFRIKLPLTLAILDGLLVRSGGQRFVLPLTSIMESIAPRPEQVSMVAGRGKVIVLRGEPLPVVRLNDLFHLGDSESLGLAVIVEHHGKRLALLVDELLGQQQVVIKSLETNFRKVEGAVGATILGDGQPALILDVASIAEMSRAGNRGRHLAVA